MKKTILLLLTLTLILGVFASCQKRYLRIDDETSSSPSESTNSESKETTEDEDADISVETTSEENESVSPITTEIIDDTMDITVDTLGNAETEAPEYLESYTIEEIDGQYYMVFNSYDVDPDYNAGWILEQLAPGFNSVEAYLYALVNKTFNIDDLVYMVRNFSRNEHGIPIFDPTDMYIPALPQYWEFGEYMDFSVVSFQDGQRLIFSAVKGDIGWLAAEMITKDAFDRRLQDEMKKSEFEFIQGEQKNVYLTEVDTGDPLFYEYIMYVVQGEHYCRYNIIMMNGEPLSREQLLSFGIEKYEQ